MRQWRSPFLLTILASLFFARIVDVVYTDVTGNASPTLALTNRIVLGMAPLWSGKALGKITVDCFRVQYDSSKVQGIVHANRTTKYLRNQGRTKGEGWSTEDWLKSPSHFFAGRPKAALLFWFFVDFRCGVLLLAAILVMYRSFNQSAAGAGDLGIIRGNIVGEAE